MICPCCKKEFQLNGQRGGQNRIYCYECLPVCSDRAERNKARRLLFKKMSDKIKLTRGCDRCGYNKCAEALEWHHPGEDKDTDPSNLLAVSMEAYQKEIEKCELLCANCHREEHFKLKNG